MLHWAQVWSSARRVGRLNTNRGSAFFPVSTPMMGFMSGVWETRIE